MVDEQAYGRAREARTPLACVFSKAILAGCASCSTSARHALGEREAVGCASAVAHAHCATLAAMLRERAAFALGLAPAAPLPHAAAMKLQCGGIAGVREASAADETDVHRLVAGEMARRGSLADLPWPAIVASVARWQGRRPRRERPDA